MQLIETGLVIGVNRYKVNSSTGGSLYLLQENHGGNDQLIGLEVKKIDMPYAMFEQFKSKKLPGEYEVLVDAERGGQDEAKISALSAKFLPPDEKSIEALLNLFGSPIPQQAKQTDSTRPLSGSAVMLILSASCYVMEEENLKGGRIYVGQLSSGRNLDQIGMEVIKLRMPFELFSQLKDVQLPGEYMVKLLLERGARDKGRYRAVGVSGENQLTRERLMSIMGFKPISTIPRVDSSNPDKK